MAVQDFTPATNTPPTAAPVVSYATLDAGKKTLVDYRALSGWVSTDDNELGVRRMTMDELAGKLGVSRQTLYDWQNNTPNFWAMVNQRRSEVSGESRLSAVEKVWLTKALKGEWQHLNAWLINYKPGYKTPTAKVEHEAGQSLVDLFRQVEQQRPVIEATVTTDGSAQQ